MGKNWNDTIAKKQASGSKEGLQPIRPRGTQPKAEAKPTETGKQKPAAKAEAKPADKTAE